QITAPDIAENGMVVPISVTSNLAKTQSIAILVEKNPSTLSASFDIPDGTDPFVQTRVKMGQSSNVYAVVKADGKYYSAVKEIKVTLGGCGGRRPLGVVAAAKHPPTDRLHQCKTQTNK
ncbi:MAG: thiosulfate oxidation carrier protein SoxY, partial [Proteobacteria bacterium]|nr:thiosulfate oxidation carrier protein SoxY [Pseudomonadota bacterium]